MDIQMPVMDGYEATRQIRNMPGMGDLPIFAMTANALVGDAEKSIKAGMNGHIAKPVDPDELYQTLSEQLKQTNTQATNRTTIGPWKPPKEDPPGLNIHRGIKQVGGNPDFYLKLLGNFISNHGDCVNQLNEMLQQTKFEDARRTAHTIKGVSGNIGAYDLQKFSTELEKILADGQLPSDEMLGNFTQACETLFSTIRNIMPH
jgi:HPt (histidine-containing phosphotransfer) domain-containing protein